MAEEEAGSLALVQNHKEIVVDSSLRAMGHAYPMTRMVFTLIMSWLANGLKE